MKVVQLCALAEREKLSTAKENKVMSDTRNKIFYVKPKRLLILTWTKKIFFFRFLRYNYYQSPFQALKNGVRAYVTYSKS